MIEGLRSDGAASTSIVLVHWEGEPDVDMNNSHGTHNGALNLGNHTHAEFNGQDEYSHRAPSCSMKFRQTHGDTLSSHRTTDILNDRPMHYAKSSRGQSLEDWQVGIDGVVRAPSVLSVRVLRSGLKPVPCKYRSSFVVDVVEIAKISFCGTNSPLLSHNDEKSMPHTQKNMRTVRT